MALTLGEIVSALEKSKTKEAFQVDTPFGYMGLNELTSYRGFYDQLALVVGPGYLSKKREEVLDMFRSAVGKAYTGYKGGRFVMTADTYIWVVLDSSRVSDLVISGIDEEWGIISTGPPPY